MTSGGRTGDREAVCFASHETCLALRGSSAPFTTRMLTRRWTGHLVCSPRTAVTSHANCLRERGSLRLRVGMLRERRHASCLISSLSTGPCKKPSTASTESNTSHLPSSTRAVTPANPRDLTGLSQPLSCEAHPHARATPHPASLSTSRMSHAEDCQIDTSTNALLLPLLASLLPCLPLPTYFLLPCSSLPHLPQAKPSSSFSPHSAPRDS